MSYNLGTKSSNKSATSVNKDKTDILLILLFLVIAIIISLVNLPSLFSFLFFFFLLQITCRVVFHRNYKVLVFTFLFYTLVSIFLYLFQYITLPSYYGFTGPPGGIGTDDSKFFYEAINGQRVAPDLKPLPGDIHHYSQVLRPFALLFSFIGELHLLDMLMFNVYGLTFAPLITAKVARELTHQRKVAKLAFTFTLICPILFTNGLILVRDGWTAVLFIVAIYFLLKNRFFLLTATVVFLFFLRVASGVELMVALGLIGYYHFQNSNARLSNKYAVLAFFILFILPVSTAILGPILVNYFFEKGFDDGLFREGFLTESVERSGEDSIFYEINQQPALVRIPLAFFFFFAAPFFTLDVSNQGVVIPRKVVLHLFPILFLFYIKYFIQGLLHSWKNNQKAIFYGIVTFSIIILMLSQMSLQFRHKTIVMPLFYIIAAYGAYNWTPLGKLMGIATALSLLLLQVILLF